MRANTEMHLPGDLLIESSIDAMIAVGPDDIITEWNSAATVLFSLSRDKTIGQSLFDVLPSLKDDTALQAAIHLAREGKKSFLPASPAFTHRTHVEIHIIPLRREDDLSGILLLIHDVSHRIAKELELQRLNDELSNRLRQLRATNSELAQLTHIASHNIRGPIREIYTTVEGMLRKEAAALSNSGRASFRRIQSSLNRMNLLIDDITTLAQISTTDRPDSIVDLKVLIEELKTQLANKLRDSRTEITIGDLCEFRAHRIQVLLLLQHIFSNVIKFAVSEAPHIHLECEKTRYTAKNGDSGKTGEYYLLSITHNGSAFEKANPHMTLQVSDIHTFTGPAVAMVIAGKIMEVHSGFLSIEKTENGDTKVNCFFPVNELGSSNQPSAG